MSKSSKSWKFLGPNQRDFCVQISAISVSKCMLKIPRNHKLHRNSQRHRIQRTFSRQPWTQVAATFAMQVSDSSVCCSVYSSWHRMFMNHSTTNIDCLTLMLSKSKNSNSFNSDNFSISISVFLHLSIAWIISQIRVLFISWHSKSFLRFKQTHKILGKTWFDVMRTQCLLLQNLFSRTRWVLRKFKINGMIECFTEKKAWNLKCGLRYNLIFWTFLRSKFIEFWWQIAIKNLKIGSINNNKLLSQRF